MFRIRTLLGAAALAGAMAAPADAELIPGKSIKIKQDHTIVTVEFISADPDRTGNLYFRGCGDRHNVLITAPSTDDSGEGQYLFGNRTALAGQTMQLNLTFNKGDRLHFAFDILEPDAQPEDIYYSNRHGERKQFAWDRPLGLLQIDDVRRQSPEFDGDYNDLIVHLTFSVIPAPGSLALLGLSALVAIPSRRRTARRIDRC